MRHAPPRNGGGVDPNKRRAQPYHSDALPTAESVPELDVDFPVHSLDWIDFRPAQV